jgi:hypothetical protein
MQHQGRIDPERLVFMTPPPKPKEPNAMVWYFNMQGREVVSINARLEDLATIDAFCKKRNISRSSLMVQAALAFCAAKKGKPIPFRGPSRASTAWQLKRHAAAKARRKRCEAGHQELLQLRDLVKSLDRLPR